MIQMIGEGIKNLREKSFLPTYNLEKSEQKPLQRNNLVATEETNPLNEIEHTGKVAQGTQPDPRQKRYDLDQKAKIIGYMNHRESEEKKSNLSWFAEYTGVSRPTIYKIYNDFKEKFQNEPPGPKPTPREKIVEKLQEQLREKDEELKILERLLEEQDQHLAEKYKRRLEATLLQAAVAPMSVREIRDLLQTAFGIRLSKRKIKELIAQYSNKAREILEEMGLEEYIEMLAIDEVFAGQNPILTGVEMNSFAILICKKETSRSHLTWYKVLGGFPHLKLVVSDKATGIIKAIRLHGEDLQHPLFHQFDLFHFKRDVGRLVRHLEAVAYRKIEREYKSEKQLGKTETEEQRSKKLKQYKGHKEKALAAIEIFDATEQAMIEVYKCLDIFDEEGNCNDISFNLKRIEKASARLKKIAGLMPEKTTDRRKMESIAKQLRDPRLLLYLMQLERRLLDIVLCWKDRTVVISRKNAIKILCDWYWQTRNKKKPGLDATNKRLAALLRVRQLQLALANFDEVYSQVCQALKISFRASSLVESFNSQVRIYQQVKKGLHKNFLYLVALKWNMTPFEDGKRKGKSPCQILGVHLESSNWLDLLLDA